MGTNLSKNIYIYIKSMALENKDTLFNPFAPKRYSSNNNRTLLTKYRNSALSAKPPQVYGNPETKIDPSKLETKQFPGPPFIPPPPSSPKSFSSAFSNAFNI